MTTTTTTTPRYLTDSRSRATSARATSPCRASSTPTASRRSGRLTDAFVERSRSWRATDPLFDLDPGTPRRRRWSGGSRTPPTRSALSWLGHEDSPILDVVSELIGSSLRFHHSKLNLKGSLDRRARRGAPGRRLLPALQRRRAGGGPAARRRHGRERRDGRAPRQPPRADLHALRRQGAIRRVHARRGHRPAGSPRGGAPRPAGGQHPHPPLPPDSLVGAQHLARRAPASDQLLRRRRLRQPRIRLHQVSALRPPRARHVARSRAPHRRRHADAPDFSQGYNSIYEVQAEAAAAAAKM